MRAKAFRWLLSLAVVAASSAAPGLSVAAPRATPPCDPGYLEMTVTPATGSPVTYCTSLPHGSWDNAHGTTPSAVEWSGTFDFNGGSYQFAVPNNGKVRLLVGAQEVVDTIDPQPTATTVTATIPAGSHPVLLRYEGTAAAPAVGLIWDYQGACPAYKAEYFWGTDLTDLAYSTCTATASVDEAAQTVMGWVGSDRSVRWTGTEHYPESTRAFTLHYSGTASLQVDGRTVVSESGDQTGTAQVAGEAELVAEYKRAGANLAQFSVSTEVSACPAGTWLAEYWDSDDTAQPPVLRNCEALPDYNWTTAAGPWAAGLPATYAVRWTGSIGPGFYTFHVTGASLTVGGTALGDGAQHLITTTTPVALTYGGTGPVSLTWEPADFPARYSQSPCPAGRYLAEYFVNGSVALATCETAGVDFGLWRPDAWGAGQRTVRWSRPLHLRPGTYQFTATPSMDVRLNGAPAGANTQVLEEGPYRLAVTYTGNGTATPPGVAWTHAPPANATACAPGEFRAAYGGVATCQPAPFRPAGGEVAPADSTYSVTWTGSLHFSADTYHFTTYGATMTLRQGGTDLFTLAPGTNQTADADLDGTYDVTLSYTAQPGAPVPYVDWYGESRPVLYYYRFQSDTALVLHFNRPLQGQAANGPDAFELANVSNLATGPWARRIGITGVQVDGNRATLRLGEQVGNGQRLYLSYLPNVDTPVLSQSDSAAGLSNVALGKSATLEGADVSRVVSGVTASAISLAADDLLTVDLQGLYAIQQLSLKSTTTAGSFSLSLSRDGTAWTTISPVVTGSQGNPTLAVDGHMARYLRLSYDPGAGSPLAVTSLAVLGGPAGNSVGWFGLPILAHHTTGNFAASQALLNRNLIELVFPEALDPLSLPTQQQFTVTVDGTDYTPTSVQVTGKTVRLYLPLTVRFGQEVTLDYAKLNAPIRSARYQEADAIAGRPVTVVVSDMIALTGEYLRASQSSLGAVGGAANALDGLPATFAQTEQELNPWWQVDLGRLGALFDLELVRSADCCTGATNLKVMTSVDGVQWAVNQVYQGAALTDGSTLKLDLKGQKARYLRVELAGNASLKLAEVSVLGYPVELNLAQGAASSQSSTDGVFGADKALDGDPATQARTNGEAEPWWQVDLGRRQSLYTLEVYNPKDETEHARNLVVEVSDNGTVWTTAYVRNLTLIGAGGVPLVVDLSGYKAQYIRLRLIGTDSLRLGEVRVLGVTE